MDTTPAHAPDTPSGAPGPSAPAAAPRQLVAAVLVDLVAVLLFAVLGRRAHGEGLGVADVLATAWPFAVGLAVGWLVLLVRRVDPVSWAAGATLVVTVVGGGMLLRFATGRGTAIGFIVTATCFNILLLVGWRLIAGYSTRRAASMAAAAGSGTPSAPSKPSR